MRLGLPPGEHNMCNLQFSLSPPSGEVTKMRTAAILVAVECISCSRSGVA